MCPEVAPPELSNASCDDHEALLNMCWWDTITYNNLRTWVPTINIVPKAAVHGVARLKRAIFHEILSSKGVDNDRWKRGWKALTFLDRLLFATPSKGNGKSEKYGKMVVRRLREAWRGNWRNLWSEVAAASRLRKGAGSGENPMATDARAVNTLVKQNMVSKATTRLIGDSSFCREPDAH